MWGQSQWGTFAGMPPLNVHLLAIAIATHPNNYTTVADHIMMPGVLHWPSINCDECDSYVDIDRLYSNGAIYAVR